MTALPVSTVVVSHRRPAALRRALTGLSQLDYAPLEVIVVADAASLEAIADMPFSDALKTAVFEDRNISLARNTGLALAAGDVVAFIDDDAVPEPTWLTHLAGAFAASDVAAAGGYVRGRNGISYQWTARLADAFGGSRPLHADPLRGSVHTAPPGHAVKTEGTNMAFRRDRLCALGGFDPAFRFYLDETDLNHRLAAAGAATAIVPLAEVHHGFLAGPYRHADRVPRDLYEIGASLAVFLRKHAPEARHAQTLDAAAAEQRARVLRHMQTGGLDAWSAARLMRRFRTGIRAGQAREIAALAPIPPADAPFKPFPARPGARMELLTGGPFDLPGLRSRARGAVASGARATVMAFSYSTLFHKVRFHPDGYWEHRGGVFGRSDRSQPLFQTASRKSRLQSERERIRLQRGLSV